MQFRKSKRSRASSWRNRQISTRRVGSTAIHGSTASSFLPVMAGPKRCSIRVVISAKVIGLIALGGLDVVAEEKTLIAQEQAAVGDYGMWPGGLFAFLRLNETALFL